MTAAATDLPSYLSSIQYKLVTWIGGMSLGYQASIDSTFISHTFLMPVFEFLWGIDWVNTFTAYATIALGIERTFVLIAWVKRFRRGDYNEGKPQGGK